MKRKMIDYLISRGDNAWANYCDSEGPLEAAIRKLVAGKR